MWLNEVLQCVVCDHWARTRSLQSACVYSRHMWMSHVTYEWVISHMNASCPIWMHHKWAMSHINMWLHVHARTLGNKYVSTRVRPPANGQATHWNTLEHTGSHTLEYTGTHWNTLQHTAKHCNTLEHAGTHNNNLRHTVTTHCNTLQRALTLKIEKHTAKTLRRINSGQSACIMQTKATHCSTRQNTATHLNTLQHSATLCDTLQQSAIHLWTRCLYHANTATHCNTMQPKENTVATIETPHLRHANTLQHAATHGNTSVDIWKHTQHTATYCNWTYWNTFATSETPYLRLRSH